MALLDIANLCVEVATENGKVRIIDRLSLSLDEGEVCGLIGESGSGKSIVAKIICNEIQDNWIIRADRFRFDEVELLKLSPSKRRKVVGQKIALVAQAAMSSLDPTQKIGVQMKQNLKHSSFKGVWWKFFGWKKRRTVELLHRVGFQNHKEIIHSYPDELTEGERQKVLIAMAVANRPRLLVADEPTNALEGITKTQIFRLLLSMNKNLGTTILLASNDVNYIREYCTTLSILYCGQNMESGATDVLLKAPKHPYTNVIMHSMPDFTQPIPAKSRLGTLKGSVPLLDAMPIGCRLGPRCPFSQKICINKPTLTKLKQQTFACYFPLNMRENAVKKTQDTSPLVVNTDNTDDSFSPLNT